MRRILAMLISATAMLPAAAHAQATPAVVIGDVNLWSGPGSDYPRVSALPTGVTVTVAGCVEGWNWCDVAYADMHGWVPGDAIVVERDGRRYSVREQGAQLAIPMVGFSLAAYWDEHYRSRPWYPDRDRWAGRGQQPAMAAAPPAAPPTAMPAPPPAAGIAPQPAPEQPIPGYVTTSVNLRAGPSVGYPRVTALPAGAPVAIYGCLEGWTWCDVVYGGLRGWIAGTYVSSVQEGRPVIVQQAGPRLHVPIVSFAIGPYWDSYYRARPWYGQRARWASVPHYVAPWPRRAYVRPYYPHRPHYHARPYYPARSYYHARPYHHGQGHRWDGRGRRY